MGMSSRPMLDINTAYNEVSKTAVLSPGAGQQIILYSTQLLNRSGATIDMALLVKRCDALWNYGSLIDASVPDYTNLTTSIQAGTTQDIFTLTNNDGFLVQSPEPFNLIGLAITQIQLGGPVYSFEYYNGAAYVALPDVIATPSFAAVADTVLLFSKPLNWAVGTTAAVGGLANMYSIRVLATTAPTQIVQANAMWIGKTIHFQPQIVDGGILSVVFPFERHKILNSLEGVLPYFGTASVKNCVTAQYFSHD